MTESDTEIPNNESSKIETALNASTECNDSIIRPSALEDFAGQEKTVTRLSIMVGAALSRKEPLNHILLSGPPGLGKTTLSFILGHEMGTQVVILLALSLISQRTLLGCSPTLTKETFYSLMRFIVCQKRLKNIFTQQWRIFVSIS